MALREVLDKIQDKVHPSGLLYSTYEQRLLSGLDRSRLPRHIAVMADGNRRWARLNAPDETLVKGYEAGADKLVEFVGWCDEVDTSVVTLWVLSTENLERSQSDEIAPLLDVIVHLVKTLADKQKWVVQIVGALDLLPEETATALSEAADSTTHCTGMHINVAVAYGGRHELRDAFRSLLAEEAKKGTPLE
ncbi:MAG: undecaprenyl diphosphate synthase family protein, partial [Propionibacteriaceae bacterium]|nr:undecaprenyl diphosphate synthase family protein [Propionibacteriaceae bacterium]